MERTSNINEYHDVIADSLREIVVQTVAGHDSVVRELCIHNIMQAYTIYVTDTPEEEKRMLEDLTKLQQKKKIYQVYDVIVNRLKDIGIYTDEGKINEEFALDKLKIIMFYYQCKIGVKPTQTTRQKTRAFDRSRAELAMP
jgi:hypothetical protein